MCFLAIACYLKKMQHIAHPSVPSMHRHRHVSLKPVDPVCIPDPNVQPILRAPKCPARLQVQDQGIPQGERVSWR